MNDDELDELLNQWAAPPAPHSLEVRVMRALYPWWKRLLKGKFRRKRRPL
jgi:hypothetical protein